MKILVLNPNTTTAMTELVADGLRQHLPPGAQLVPMTARSGEAVIATQPAFDAAAAAALAMLRDAANDACDAVLLACFGDPGLEELRRAVPVPVIGMAWASMREAERTGAPYAIVTAGAAWEGLLSHRLAGWGASALFKGVQVLQGTGLSVLQNPVGMMPAVEQAIAKARQRGAVRFVLGGAVFSGYKALMAEHGLDTDDVIDCVHASANALASLAPCNPP